MTGTSNIPGLLSALFRALNHGQSTLDILQSRELPPPRDEIRIIELTAQDGFGITSLCLYRPLMIQYT